jgi:putative transcriptional regulator
MEINRLKVVLAEKKKKNVWLANEIGKNQTTISQWCTNQRQPSLETLIKIACVLEVDARELINPTKSIINGR